MTARRRNPAALGAAALTAALLLTACGSDGDDAADDVPGMGQGGDAAPSQEPENGEEPETDEEDAGHPGEPTFDFPDNFEIVIDDDTTGDPEKDELLRDHGYALMAMREGYVQQGGTENFSRYWTAPIDSDYLFDFDRYADEDLALVGIDHFYKREVNDIKGDEASVRFCESTVDGHTEKVGSGEEVGSGSSGEYADFRQYLMHLVRADEGHWQVSDGHWESGSQECAEAAR
ncbi:MULTISPECIES: hypothetical protein [unclassified Streptomyces]|uniref:hypothetical protein n=1 Tax=unclassified Streptomyces TaxID=2593676 RepID=UPI000CD4FAF2|nr:MULTISPECIES: hypothetical protein [unclassified Streptomyces]